MGFSETCGNYWTKLKPLWVPLIPILLLPLPLVVNDKVATFAYCLLIIAIFWVFEILNIYVTALLPMILLPLAGIAKPSLIAKEYMPDVCMLFIGTLILACGIEKTGVHKRMALLTLRTFGQSTRSLMFGLMLVTWFMSMWISNTATTALMLPVIEAIFGVFQENLGAEATLPASITKGLSLCIACGANIGGMGTLTGTPPNLVASSLMEENFPCYTPKLSFAQWLITAWPVSILFFILAYVYMNIYWYGLPFTKASQKYSEFSGEQIKSVINEQYDALPTMAFNEYYCVGTLVSMVIMMFFKSPGFITGWADLYPNPEKPSDSTIALFFAGLLFFVPSEFEWDPRKLDFSRPIITWNEFQAYCPWGTILLIGSGVCLSKTSDTSGFSQYIADLLSELDGLPRVGILFIIIITVGLLTEITSNTATANLILPIIQRLSVSINENPLFLVFPATLATSLAFMLPVATGPNALIFSFGRITIPDMVKCGIFLNVLGFAVIGLMGAVYAPVLLDSNDTNATWIYEGTDAVC